MTKQKMRKWIVGCLAESLKNGGLNGDLKDNLTDDEYEVFCKIELEIADEILKKLGAKRH